MRRAKKWRWGTIGACVVLLSACESELKVTRMDDAPDDGVVTTMMDADLPGPSPDAGGEDASMKPVEEDMPADMPPMQEPVLSGNRIEDQAALFTCDDSPALELGRIRRVESDQWRRNAGLRSTTTPFSNVEEHDYSTYSDGEVVDVSVLSLYMNDLTSKGAGWAARKTGNSPGKLRTVEVNAELECFLSGTTPPEDACLDTYVRYLLRRGVLFREPTDGEVARLTALAKRALELEVQEGATREETALQVVAAARMMTSALFREELGSGELDEHGRIALDDWELANALAYVLDKRAAGSTGVYQRLADGYSTKSANGHLEDIYQAAVDGTISDPAVLEALVRQYIGKIDPERRDWIMEDTRIAQGEYALGMGARDFFREWLGYHLINETLPSKVEIAETSAASGEAFVSSGYGSNITGNKHDEGMFVNQLDDVIARVVLGDDGAGGADVLERLMTTDLFYVPANRKYQQDQSNVYKTTSRINAVYGIGEGPDAAVLHTREDRWRVMPPEQKRGGVLTHPAWLASHSGSFENGAAVVHRGRWIRQHLLCQDVPDVPLGVDASLGDDTMGLSARQRIQAKTEQPACDTCHKLMNPLGYPFEEFNHTGFTRITDHGAEPSGASLLREMPDPALDGLEVQSAAEFSAALGRSPWVKRCFVRQAFRYYMGREETMADACTLTKMEAAYETRGSFVDMLVALLTSKAFTHRLDPSREEEMERMP